MTTFNTTNTTNANGPILVGDSLLGLPSQLGIEGPAGSDTPVLQVSGLADREWLSVKVPLKAGAVTDFTAVWDVRVEASTGGLQALFQTAAFNNDNAELFVDANGGLGADGHFAGSVPFGEWARITVTLSSNGDGTSQLAKYIDGEFVGEQTVETARYTLQPDQNVLLLSDNDGDTGAAAISHFGILPRTMSAEEVQDLGGVTADGPFEVPEIPADAPAPVRLTSGGLNMIGGVFAEEDVKVDGLTFESEFSMRFSRNGDGMTFQLQSEREGVPLISNRDGGELGLHPGASPTVAVMFDTSKNKWDAAANQIRVYAGGDATSTPLAAVTVPFPLAGVDVENKAWVEYDGTTLKVYISATDVKPATPILSLPIDLSDYLQDTARVGLVAATGAGTSIHDISEWKLETNDPDGPSGNMLVGDDQVELVGTSDRLAPGEYEAGDAMQLGFDGGKPQVEGGFSQVGLIDKPTTGNPILDYLVTPKDEPMTFDLTEVFGEGATDFTVTTSNGEAVDASIVDGVLTVSFGGYGLADLHLTAKGPLGQELTDDFRVRVAGEGAYTIAIMPDTQNYTGSSQPLISGIPADMAQWIADNAATKGIGFVTHVGDVTGNARADEYEIARDAFDILREAGIPFSLLPGNHDQGPNGNAGDRDTAGFNQYFGVDYMKEDPTFGGVYDMEPDLYDNNYHLWTAADGTEWIVLNLEFGPRDDVLRWANDVLTEHGDRKAMVLTHSYNSFNGRHEPLGHPLEAEGAGYHYGLGTDPQGAWDGEELWREVVSKHPNVVFTAGGHVFGDGAQTVVSYNDYGNPVFQFTVNYQKGVANEVNGGEGQGGNGAFRLVTVDPVNGAFYTETFFTEYDDYFRGVRGSEEESRDGLTGSYWDKGHQEEYFDLDLGQRDAEAIADAGNDQVVEAEGDTATVELSAGDTTDPRDEIVSWLWTDKDGNVIATGKDASVDLGAGVHDLTLTVTTSEGVVSSDDVRVIVKTDDVWLVDNFNDGKADGWVLAGAADPMAKFQFGTTASFGVPAIGGQAAEVARIDRLAPGEGLHVKPDAEGRIYEYTLVYDLYLPAGQGGYAALLQTDIANSNDADLFLRNLGNGTVGVGASSNYPAGFPMNTWARVVVTLTVEDGAHVMRRYVNGEQIGSPLTVDADITDTSRWSIDADKGFLLFADESNETSQLYVSSVAFLPESIDDAAVHALGGIDADGPYSAGTLPAGGLQLNFDGSIEGSTIGTGEVHAANLTYLNGVFVKGSSTIDNPLVVDPQGALFDRSGAANSTLVREGGDFDNMIVEVTLRSMGKNSIGVAFNRSEDGDQYLVVFNNVTNTRQLVRIENGQTVVLATEAGGYTFNDAQNLVISKVDGRITVTLDGLALFGGAVVDLNPLQGGTIGLYSSGQVASIFDDVVVRAAETTAHAGNDKLVIDWDNDGTETIDLDGTGTVLAGADGSDGRWTGKDIDATGLETEVTVGGGRNTIEFELDGSTDKVNIDLATGDRLIAADRFEDGNANGWRIVDTTELGGDANWQVIGGKLVETSGAYSRELTYNGQQPVDVWQKGWSPLGDGTFALHKGTYALWEGNDELSDYAIQAKLAATGGSVGFMLNYVDENNYYKIEIDSRAGTGLITLIKVVNNYESLLARSAGTFTPGKEFLLEARVVDGKISATIDGHDVFAYPIEDHSIKKGAAGVYAWGSAGAAFDDIAIVDLSTPFGATIAGTAGDDEMFGSSDDDVIHAAAGDDVVSAAAGDDIVDGGEGDDTLAGGEGDDILMGGDGDDELFGEDGDDVLKGGAGDDLLDGGDGIDTVDFSDDTAGVAVNLAEGFAEGDATGTDELVSIENVIGGSGNDRLIGDAGDNTFVGGAGNDTIDGGNGIDTLDLRGATGGVTFSVASGTVSGGGLGTDRFSNIERFVFGDFDNQIAGGNNDDSFVGGAGKDTIKGGAGDDNLAGGAGHDNLDGGSGNDTVDGGLGDDLIKAGSGDDVVKGGLGNDDIDGGSGDDRLEGGAGNDTIDGGSGDDTIIGGAGDDVMTAGSGKDVFVFAAGFGKDRITDFRTSGTSADVLDFGDLFDSYADVMAHATQQGADVVISYDADNSVTLTKLQLSSLSADDFRFS